MKLLSTSLMLGAALLVSNSTHACFTSADLYDFEQALCVSTNSEPQKDELTEIKIEDSLHLTLTRQQMRNIQKQFSLAEFSTVTSLLGETQFVPNPYNKIHEFTCIIDLEKFKTTKQINVFTKFLTILETQ